MNRPGRVRVLPVLAVVVVVLAACLGGSEPDQDELGGHLDDDGRAIVEAFETDEPRGGDVAEVSVLADGSADLSCDGGHRREWRAEFAVAWPGDPADPDRVDTLFDGTTDFVVARFGELGYQTVSQEFGDGADPRSVVVRREVSDDAAELEFTVTFRLAAEQPGARTVAADVGVSGATPCLAGS